MFNQRGCFDLNTHIFWLLKPGLQHILYVHLVNLRTCWFFVYLKTIPKCLLYTSFICSFFIHCFVRSVSHLCMWLCILIDLFSGHLFVLYSFVVYSYDSCIFFCLSVYHLLESTCVHLLHALKYSHNPFLICLICVPRAVYLSVYMSTFHLFVSDCCSCSLNDWIQLI